VAICLSIRSSVRHVDCDKTEEKSVQIFIPYKRSFSLVFKEKEWLVGGDPFFLKFGQSDCVGAKAPILNRFSLIPQP